MSQTALEISCLLNTSSAANKAILFPTLYQGIPETLILNLIGWGFLILLFAILRNYAWDYGRLALVQNEKWTKLFYNNVEETVDENAVDVSIAEDQAFCKWLPSIFTYSKEKILNRCGPDALHYLSFQKHLIILHSIITAVSLGIVLPINFQGILQGDTHTFGHTTLSNLEPTSHWVWAHVFVCVMYVPLTIIVLKKCSAKKPADKVPNNSIMITNISKPHRSTEDIYNYFSLLYSKDPFIEVKDVQLAYNIQELFEIEQQRKFILQAKTYCEKNSQKTVLVSPNGCYLCCPCKSIDALEYYTAEERRLSEIAEERRRNALRFPLGIAFVTVSDHNDAQHIVNTFRGGSRRNWIVHHAPEPSDIMWENLHISGQKWYSRTIVVNSVLFLVLFFLTTPAIVVSLYNSYSTKIPNLNLNRTIAEFLPTLLLWTMSAVLPAVVAYSDRWLPYWTLSTQNVATMQKTFFFLLFMVLILPSLGLTSAAALLEFSWKHDNQTDQWQCIFLPDKGAFFVNYVITCAFLGTALDLIRFPELALYALRILTSRSVAERQAIQKEVLVEFPYGIHYAWTLLVYTVSVVYSVACPLVTPFGLLYLFFKRIVDRHNIYYAYKPSSMTAEGSSIHVRAVALARVAIVLLQVVMAVFALVRGGLTLISVLMVTATVLTLGIFFVTNPFPKCKPVFSRRTVEHAAPRNSILQQKYVAPVFHNEKAIPLSNLQATYGSSDQSPTSLDQIVNM